VADPYYGREQTKAKHFILKHYLQALAFKVLTFSDITYVDGFSGPWETRTDDFSDASFMIAIDVLRDAQEKIFKSKGVRRRIRCFFSENNAVAFLQLKDAVLPFHMPAQQFEIKTYCGKFEDAVGEIQTFVGDSFPLIFIDPTGWTGYPFDKIKPLFARTKCEVLINFMYEFVNRFVQSDDEETITSFDPIFGGTGWRDRLDHSLPRGRAVEALFRETLKLVGRFDFVISTKIDKTTADRPHFFIIYATKSLEGLKAFRETEYDALRAHVKNRANAKERQREERSDTPDLFQGHHAVVEEALVDEIVAEQKLEASVALMAALRLSKATKFSQILASLLQVYMLRETNVKDICVELARRGNIENTWGSGTRKPKQDDLIRIKQA